MSTTPTAARPWWKGWADFWFRPSDPTTLGFIRVMTGLLIVYIHLAYTLDLQAFFGKHGWYGQGQVDRERHEYPYAVPSLTDWDDTGLAMARVPEFPHRRAAVMDFVRSLPAGRDDRGRAVRYFDRLAREESRAAVEGLRFVSRAYAAPADGRAAVAAALKEGKPLYDVDVHGVNTLQDRPPAGRTAPEVIPAFLLALPPAERENAAADIAAAVAALPADPVAAKYVLGHLVELDPAHRRAFVAFLVNLPDDPAERARVQDYLEYWNTDPDPNKVIRKGHYLVSVWFHVTDPTQMAVIHGLCLFVMVLFTLGAATRVTGVLTWLACIGYIHRTNQILFGMDTMMNILLVYLVVGNSGAAVSVDRLVARYRAARASLARCGRIDDPTRAFLDRVPPSSGANFGVRLIQVHFCFIYMAAGLSKLKGPAWWNGTAFWDVMINPEFTLLRYPWFEMAFRELVGYKLVYYAVTMFGVWFTWGLEIAFPFLIWTRLRPVMIWLAVLLHAGIGVLMGLNLFELLMLIMLLAYLPPGVIRDRLRGKRDGLPVRLGCDPAVPAQARAAALLAAADLDAQVTLDPAKGKAVPALTTADGKPADPFRTLRLLKPLGWVPGAAAAARGWLFPAPKPAAEPREVSKGMARR